MGGIEVFQILAIVLAGLTAAGVIAVVIMKKMKVREQVLSISYVIVTLIALLMAGVLVYIVSVQMMVSLMETKQYKTFSFENDDKSLTLIIKEYNSANETGFEIYTEEDGEMLKNISTNEYLPFAAGEYDLQWDHEKLTIYYVSEQTEDSAECRKITVDLKNKTVTESEKAEHTLSHPEESASVSAVSKTA